MRIKWLQQLFCVSYQTFAPVLLLKRKKKKQEDWINFLFIPVHKRQGMWCKLIDMPLSFTVADSKRHVYISKWKFNLTKAHEKCSLRGLRLKNKRDSIDCIFDWLIWKPPWLVTAQIIHPQSSSLDLFWFLLILEIIQWIFRSLYEVYDTAT